MGTVAVDPIATILPDQLEEIRARLASPGLGVEERVALADQFGISHAELSRMVIGKSKHYESNESKQRARAGAIGGLASAARRSREEHEQRASERGLLTLQRYGSGYYAALGRASAKARRERQQQAS